MDITRRPCACGGVVTVYGNEIEGGVRVHQRSQRHRRWRERGGMEQKPRRVKAKYVLEHGYRVPLEGLRVG